MKPGFTLLEFMMVMAMMAALTAMSFVVYIPAQTTNNLAIATESVVSAMRLASQNARAMQWNSPWGVYVTATSVTMFAGSSYVSRTTGLDEVTDLASLNAVSGTTEFVFSEYYGYPSVSSTLRLVKMDGDLRSIVVNSRGMIQY